MYNGQRVPRFFYGDVFPGDNGYWLLPNPALKSTDEAKLNTALENRTEFDNNYRIYCFNRNKYTKSLQQYRRKSPFKERVQGNK